eukprot:GGOE01014069.1.p1 GENE.GGOE01014069.1~~GGOE01014069.1.p1  ORF type:complete len:143 (-),score=38.70 GGOE01014069.1:251-631(-)
MQRESLLSQAQQLDEFLSASTESLDVLESKMRIGIKQLEDVNLCARRFEIATTRLSKNISDLDDRLLKLDNQRDQIRDQLHQIRVAELQKLLKLQMASYQAEVQRRTELEKVASDLDDAQDCRMSS